MALKVDTFIADGTWTCPSGVTSALVECWGAGGGGTNGSGGGGGGAYSRKTVSVTPSTGYAIQVGVSAANTDGEDSTFDSTVVVAKGGLSGGNGGTGGQAGDCTGDQAYSGADGDAGSGSKHGGGAAGDSADASGRGGGSTNGGCGGSRSNTAAWGQIVGGGGKVRIIGRSGGGGQVRVSYEISDVADMPNVQARSWGKGSSDSISISLPSGINEDDLLIIIVSSLGNVTYGCSGWTEVDQLPNANNRCSLGVFYKVAVGGGGDSATVTVSSSQNYVYTCYRITNGAVVEGTLATASGATASNPPEHVSSEGTVNHLWIAATARRPANFPQIDPGGGFDLPANYDSFITITQCDIFNLQGSDLVMGSCERQIETDDTEDPGSFSGNNVSQVSATLSIVYYTSEYVLTGASGIESGEAFGADGVVAQNLLDGRDVAGITSGEAFGSGGSCTGPITGAAGIPSEEAFGSGGEAWVYEQLIQGSAGISSGEAFGSGGSVTGPITGAAGIASGEAFGAGGSVIGPIIGSVGIPSEEAFGSGGSVSGPITGAAGIASGEAFGSGGYVATIVGNKGIPSALQFGAGGSLVSGIVGLDYMGIPSGEAFGTTGAVLQLSTDNSNFAAWINGVQVAVEMDEIHIDRQLNFASACELFVQDPAGTWFPEVGQEVLIWYYHADSDTWKKIFAGQIEAPGLSKTAGIVTDPDNRHRISCVDYARTLSKRIVRKKYPEAQFGTLTAILQDLSEHYLEPEGISWVNQGDPGVTIGDLEFADVPLNEVLDQLHEIVDWDWQIDYDKNLYFFDRPNLITAAPFAIDEDLNEEWRNMEVTRNRGLYRNRVYIKANFTRTSSIKSLTFTNLTDGYIDGHYTYYNGEFLTSTLYQNQIQNVLDVKVNGVSVPWFAQDLEPAPADWDYMLIWAGDFSKIDLIWNLLGKPGAAPGLGETVTIEFEVYNQLPEPIVVDNSSEIAARAAVEGGTGIYASVAEVTDIEDRDLLIEYATKLLDRFSEMGLELDFETDLYGLEPGQQIAVDLPSYNVSPSNLLVEAMSIEEVQKTLLRQRVKVSNQIQQRDALAAMQRLIRRIRKSGANVRTFAQWDVAVTYPGAVNPGLTVGTNVTNEIILGQTITLAEIEIYLKEPPEGADAKFDIRADGTTIFPAGTYLTYPTTGGQVVHKIFADAPLTLPESTRLRLDIIQAGTTAPGSDGTILLKARV